MCHRRPFLFADAADALARGDFGAPLPSVDATRRARGRAARQRIGSMRSTLAERNTELRDGDDALADRNARLGALQADLVQRERLAASATARRAARARDQQSGASLRNCLELIHRRFGNVRRREFADLAIDELLRMHELAEQMLDVNRPRDAASHCADAPTPCATWSAAHGWRLGEPAPIALVGARARRRGRESGRHRGGLRSSKCCSTSRRTRRDAISACRREEQPVAARPTSHPSSRTRVPSRCGDNGGGLPAERSSRAIFDLSTRRSRTTCGVGLGLIVAEGLVAWQARLTLSGAPRDCCHSWRRFSVELLPRRSDADATHRREKRDEGY